MGRFIINNLGDGRERKTDMGTVLLKDVVIPLDEEGYDLCKTVLDEILIGDSELAGGVNGTAV